MSDRNPTSNTRLARLETAFAQLTTQLGEFIQDSKEHRDRQERSEAKLWESIEKLATRNVLTWPVIVMTVGMIITLVGGAARIGHLFTTRENEHLREVIQLHVDYLDQADKRARERIDRHDKQLGVAPVVPLKELPVEE